MNNLLALIREQSKNSQQLFWAFIADSPSRAASNNGWLNFFYLFKKGNSYFFLLLFFFSLMGLNCNPLECHIVSNHPNGEVERILCEEDNSDLICFKTFFDTGNLKSEYCMENDKIVGKVDDYFDTGVLKSTCNYENGLRNGLELVYYTNGRLSTECYYENGKIHGICMGKRTNGKPDFYSFFSNGERYYYKSYEYVDEVFIENEIFVPIVSFLSDTILEPNTRIDFIVDFPLPDSLYEGRALYFAYEIKPYYLKDSINITPENEFKLNKKENFLRSIDCINRDSQIFYSHIIDKKTKQIFEPTEKLFVIKPAGARVENKQSKQL